MDDRDRRQRMCGTKARYRDEAAAQAAIERQRWDERSGAALRCYPCEYCGRWHLTSQAPR